mmetsp:Transcript_8420/g.10976  ORF Transcript_8420/g.10976 Transcript_8420/m.10976 type:complete len:744 (+) Transcript_8420:355-2586(+)
MKFLTKRNESGTSLDKLHSHSSSSNFLIEYFVVVRLRNKESDVYIEEIFPRHDGFQKESIPESLLTLYCSKLIVNDGMSFADGLTPKSFILPHVDGIYYYVSAIKHFEVLESFNSPVVYALCLLSRRPCLEFMENMLVALSQIIVERNPINCSISDHAGSIGSSNSSMGSDTSVGCNMFNRISTELEVLINLTLPSEETTLEILLDNMHQSKAGIGRFDSATSTSSAYTDREYSISSCVRIFPRMKHLPFVDDRSFTDLLSNFNAEAIVCVLECLLAEKSLVLCSNNDQSLVHFAEGLLSLMFPFVWQGLYSPLLLSARDCSNSFVDKLKPVFLSNSPFIVGWTGIPCNICSQSRNCSCSFQSTQKFVTDMAKNISQTRQCCFVDVDNGSVAFSFSEPPSRLLPEPQRAEMLRSIEMIQKDTVNNVDKFRFAVAQFFVVLLAHAKERDFIESIRCMDSLFSEEILKSRYFGDFVKRTSRGEAEDFLTLVHVWENTEVSGKRSKFARQVQPVLLKLLKEYGYTESLAVSMTDKIILLEPTVIVNLLKSKENLVNKLNEISREDELGYSIRSQRGSRMEQVYEQISRPSVNTFPPTVIRMNRHEIDCVSMNSEESFKAEFHWSPHGARLGAILLAGFGESLSESCSLSSSELPHEEEYMYYELHRERLMYQDTIAALSARVKVEQAIATTSVHKSEQLEEENARLKRELARLKGESRKKSLPSRQGSFEPWRNIKPIVNRSLYNI